jgi:septation ring formation regulator EzrA
VPAGAQGNRQQLINRAAEDLEAYQRLTAQGRYSEAGQRLESVRKTLSQLRGAAQ